MVDASTFYSGQGGAGFGGPGSTVAITSSTFAGGGYSGLWLTGSSVTVAGTVVSGNFYEGACQIYGGATVISGGYNSASDATCGFTDPTDTQGVVSTFEPFRNNGGPTRSLLPTPTSPLIDAIPVGTPGLCDGSPATDDQRGVPRPQGPGCDIGAVETSGLVVDTAVDGSDNDPGDGACDDGTGACTLRAAIEEANAQVSVLPEIITIAPGIDPVVAPQSGPGAIAEPLTIAGGLVIDGGGATVSATNRSNLFVVADLDTVVRNLTVTGDVAVAFAAVSGGGGDPALTLDHVTVDLTELPGTSAVAFTGRALTILDSSIATRGGAINAAVADLLVERTSVVGDDGLWAEEVERATIRQSSFEGGDSELLVHATESIVVERSTAAGSYYGASLFAPSVRVHASTFTGSQGWLLSTGGGEVSISASTLHEPFGQGALWVSAGATVTVSGSVVSGGSTWDGACQIDAGGALISGGYNVASDATCGFAGIADVVADPALGPLAANGGPTRTRLPNAGSPVINVIPWATPGLCDWTDAFVRPARHRSPPGRQLRDRVRRGPVAVSSASASASVPAGGPSVGRSTTPGGSARGRSFARAWWRRGQPTRLAWPPSTARITPVMKLASSDARKSTA